MTAAILKNNDHHPHVTHFMFEKLVVGGMVGCQTPGAEVPALAHTPHPHKTLKALPVVPFRAQTLHTSQAFKTCFVFLNYPF